MPTDGGDIAGIAGSTASGAAAGFTIGGPVGGIIGGSIGFLSGIFSNAAENEAEKLEALQIEREKKAAGLSGEARELQLYLNSLELDRNRKAFATKAFLANEAITSAGALTGLMGSSIAKNARASIGQQHASSLQHSFLTEEIGTAISNLHQDALDARLGIGEDNAAGKNVPSPVKGRPKETSSSKPNRPADRPSGKIQSPTGDGGENVPLFDMSQTATADNIGTAYVTDAQYGAI